MANKNFLLLSLEDAKAKKVANVVSNDSCRKILDHLAAAEGAAESDIAKDMKLPISTVHYNLQLLMEAGLVEVDEFHYSKKGKEVNHYKLANKYIIIAPQKEAKEGMMDRLKSIFPVAIITVAIAAIIQFATMIFRSSAKLASGAGMLMTNEASRSFAKSAPMVADRAMEASGGSGVATSALSESAPAVADSAAEMAYSGVVPVQNVVQTVVVEHNIAFWFLVGALSALAIFLLIGMIRKGGRKRKNRNGQQE